MSIFDHLEVLKVKIIKIGTNHGSTLEPCYSPLRQMYSTFTLTCKSNSKVFKIYGLARYFKTDLTVLPCDGDLSCNIFNK